MDSAAVLLRPARHVQPPRGRFAYVADYLDIPEWITETPHAPRLGEVKWTLGYRGMCRFRSGPIFTHPAVRSFDYAMTLDTDGSPAAKHRVYWVHCVLRRGVYYY